MSTQRVAVIMYRQLNEDKSAPPIVEVFKLEGYESQHELEELAEEFRPAYARVLCIREQDIQTCTRSYTLRST